MDKLFVLSEGSERKFYMGHIHVLKHCDVDENHFESDGHNISCKFCISKAIVFGFVIPCTH